MRHDESLNLDLLFTWEAFLPLSLSFLGFGRGIDALQKALFRQRRTREVLGDRPLKAGYGGTSCSPSTWETRQENGKFLARQKYIGISFIYTCMMYE